MSNYQTPPPYGPPQDGYAQPPQPVGQQYAQPYNPADQQQYAMAPGVNPNMPVQSVSHTPPSDEVSHGGSITVGPFLLNFPKLFRPDVYTPKGEKPDPNAVPKFSCELWLLRSSPDFDRVYNELHTALNAVSIGAFKIPWDSPQFNMKAIRDLIVKGDGTPPGIFVKPSSTQPPKPVVGDPPRLATEDEMYSGCFVYANINPASFSRGTRGLKWYLNGIWKVADGERLISERDPVSGFTHLLGKVQTQYRSEAPAGMQPPPQMGQMPPAYPHQPQYPPQQYAQPPMPGYQHPPMPGYQH